MTAAILRVYPSCKMVDVFNFQPADVDIVDIAHSLAQSNRYTGHCKHPYSVAQHSVLLRNLVPLHLKAAALLHDAAEAYMIDLPNPIKVHFPVFKEIEDRILRVIFDVFGIDFGLMDELHPWDRSMYQEEHQVLQLGYNVEHYHRFVIDEWDWRRAKREYLYAIMEEFGI